MSQRFWCESVNLYTRADCHKSAAGVG